MNVIAFRPREFKAAEARAAELPHRRNYDNPTDARIGSPLGLAAIRGLISKEEFDAASSWGAVHSNYLETIKNPDAFTDAWCERSVAQYQRGLDVLERHPKRVFHAVMALAAYGEDWGDLEYTVNCAKIALREMPQKY